MRMSRRFAVVGALVVVAVLAAGCLWWEFTGRYDRALAKTCAGMLPARESEPFADGNLKKLGGNAVEKGYFCRIGDEFVQIARVPDDLDHFSDVLHSGVSDENVTVPLGGGWRGFTDLNETGVTLPCTNRRESVLVLATGLGDELTPATAHPVAELVTAVAVRAAAHYHCAPKPGGRIPPIATPPRGEPSITPTGTCRGLPLHSTTVRSTGSTRDQRAACRPWRGACLAGRSLPRSATTSPPRHNPGSTSKQPTVRTRLATGIRRTSRSTGPATVAIPRTTAWCRGRPGVPAPASGRSSGPGPTTRGTWRACQRTSSPRRSAHLPNAPPDVTAAPTYACLPDRAAVDHCRRVRSTRQRSPKVHRRTRKATGLLDDSGGPAQRLSGSVVKICPLPCPRLSIWDSSGWAGARSVTAPTPFPYRTRRLRAQTGRARGLRGQSPSRSAATASGASRMTSWPVGSSWTRQAGSARSRARRAANGVLSSQPEQ